MSAKALVRFPGVSLGPGIHASCPPVLLWSHLWSVVTIFKRLSRVISSSTVNLWSFFLISRTDNNLSSINHLFFYRVRIEQDITKVFLKNSKKVGIKHTLCSSLMNLNRLLVLSFMSILICKFIKIEQLHIIYINVYMQNR